MATLPFLIAFAIAGGQIAFTGSVATPTAASVPVIEHPSETSAERITVRIGRFDDPPRVVSTRPMDSDAERTVVVVTYL